MPETAAARVGIVMGSDSDWPVMAAAAEALAEFEVAYEADVVSAHRMPDAMIDYGRTADRRGLAVIIAGAGGAAHLPGMLAAVTPLPVIGVPVPLKYLDGMDSLLSIVQMPAGVPVATVAIGNARNAGLLAVRILAGVRRRAQAAHDRVPRSAAAGRPRPRAPTVRGTSSSGASRSAPPNPSARLRRLAERAAEQHHAAGPDHQAGQPGSGGDDAGLGPAADRGCARGLRRPPRVRDRPARRPCPVSR